MEFQFCLAVLVVSTLYASVGHGGASGYLALMALYGFAPDTMKPTALILNLFVAGFAFIQFYRNGFFRPGLFGIFAVTSIPAAFLGGMIQLDPDLYRKLLGILLIFPVLRMMGVFGAFSPEKTKDVKQIAALITGSLIGFFSGVIGIGGGILLSPVILLLGWADTKGSAAVSALFIWINSLAALAGGFATGLSLSSSIVPMIAVALVGSAAGGYLGSFKISSKRLKYMLSAVLMIATVKLILL